MKIAIHQDFFKEIMLNESKISKRNMLLNILFNPSNTIVTTKKYFNKIETECNDESIKSLLLELIDLNKIEIVNSLINNQEEFLNVISNNGKFDVALSYKTEFDLENLIILSKATSLNIHEIGKKLLEHSSINVSYLNFKTNDQIEKFIKDIFSICSCTSKISIFDRDKCERFLGIFKGRNIEYYTFYRRNSVEFNYRTDDVNRLKLSLGKKLDFYFTHNSALLHERKVIIGNLLITFDNSRNNININEPTWEIFANNDSLKASNWMKKSCKFSK